MSIEKNLAFDIPASFVPNVEDLCFVANAAVHSDQSGFCYQRDLMHTPTF